MIKTNIYHITYTPGQKDVNVHFWGCNFYCRGCYCQRDIYSPMLNFRRFLAGDPKAKAEPPTRFLSLDEVQGILDELDFKTVVLEGQEAGLDPAYCHFTELVHRRYGATVTLVTNARTLPDLTYTDTVEVGLKALNDDLHRAYTGVSNHNTLANLNHLIDIKKKVLVDTVVIPGYIDGPEIESIAAHLTHLDPAIPFILLPYFPCGDNPWHRPSPQEMDLVASVARKHLKLVFHFRGNEELNHPMVNIFPRQAEASWPSDRQQFERKAEVVYESAICTSG